MKNNRVDKIKLLFVMIVFMFPLIVGSLLYHFRHELHFKTLNHGTLVNPPMDVSHFWKSDGKWEIVYIPAECPNDQDQKKMFLLHQLRLILGNDSRRASLVLIKLKSCPAVDKHDFMEVGLSEDELRAIGKNKIVLVDPKGNLFMSYPVSTDLMNIYNDLKRVFEVSQIG